MQLIQHAAEPAEVLYTPSCDMWLARITQGTCPAMKLVICMDGTGLNIKLSKTMEKERQSLVHGC